MPTRSRQPRYEAEVRFPLGPAAQLSHRLREAGGRLRLRYSFTDTVFRRPGDSGQAGAVLRLREERRPRRRCRLLLSVGQTRAAGGLVVRWPVLGEGKVCLYEGTRRDAERVARALGFEPQFHVHHLRGRAWALPGGAEVVVEEVRAEGAGRAVELGWWAEVAVRAASPRQAGQRLRSVLRWLGLEGQEGLSEGFPRFVERALAGGPARGVEARRLRPYVRRAP